MYLYTTRDRYILYIYIGMKKSIKINLEFIKKIVYKMLFAGYYGVYFLLF